MGEPEFPEVTVGDGKLRQSSTPDKELGLGLDSSSETYSSHPSHVNTNFPCLSSLSDTGPTVLCFTIVVQCTGVSSTPLFTVIPQTCDQDLTSKESSTKRILNL